MKNLCAVLWWAAFRADSYLLEGSFMLLSPFQCVLHLMSNSTEHMTQIIDINFLDKTTMIDTSIQPILLISDMLMLEEKNFQV